MPNQENVNTTTVRAHITKNMQPYIHKYICTYVHAYRRTKGTTNSFAWMDAELHYTFPQWIFWKRWICRYKQFYITHTLPKHVQSMHCTSIHTMYVRTCIIPSLKWGLRFVFVFLFFAIIFCCCFWFDVFFSCFAQWIISGDK